jgi:hypothetical protein
VPGIGRVKEERHQRVSTTVLIDRGGTVANPLTRHEHRHRAVKLELNHFRRSRVSMPAKITDETAGRGLLPGPVAVADPGGPLHVFIGAHVVDERDEAVVE